VVAGVSASNGTSWKVASVPRPCNDFAVADGEPRERFGWETWEWDESVFAGTAAHYRRGRPPYSPALADAVAEAIDLDHRPRLLDVGCGSGVVALRLASLFEEVIGLDPDAAMLDEAARAAEEEHVKNVSWVRMRAEDLPGDLGHFRVIAFAQSFHWMDRPRVAASTRDMVDPNGAVIQIDAFIDSDGDPSPRTLPHPPVPTEDIEALRMRYLGPDRRAGQSYRNTSPSGEEAIFQAAGFLPEQTYRARDDRILERTVEDVVAWVFAASYTAPHLFGEDLPKFEQDLRRILLERSPSGLFSVALRDNNVRVRRPDL
jgi:SAM-dependent methyltransferase